MGWFSRPRSRPLAARPTTRLGVEVLEDRTVLNNRFVVPVGVPVDNVTNFATLAAAMTTSGLSTGDVIQIQPGATPGNVTSAVFTIAFTTAATLTIQGDPVVSASAIPQFTVSDATTIAAAKTLNLTNASLGLISTGNLTLNGNASITSSVLVDINSSAATPFTFAGVSNNLINSTVVNNTPLATVLVRVATNAAGTSHQIRGNTFVSNATTATQLSWSGGSSVAVTDVASDNTFSVTPGASVSTLVSVGNGLSGLVIRNNSLTGNASYGMGVSTSHTNLQILNNGFDLRTNNSVGIDISSGATAASATIANNVIRTNGVGIGMTVYVNAGAMSLKVEGNDFRGGRLGVEVNAGANSVANVDFGVGTQGSLGANTFRGFTAAATDTTGAIATDSTTGAMQAQNNIFSVPNPQTVIFRSGAGTVNTAGQLTGNAATVAALYNTLLKRAGNTNLPADAGNWVTALNNGATLASVANAIGRSAEALGLIADGLYQKVLRRAADSGGRANLVTFLQSHTVEQAVVELTRSVEFNTQAGTDGGFVQLLYGRLLGRIASAADVASWQGVIAGSGRAAVTAGVVGSAEYRGLVVQTLYGFAAAPLSTVASIFPNLLHRTSAPTDGEVNPWVNSGFDTLSICLAFASTAEFVING